jgi:HK97 gp10 family phage protein
MARITVVNNRLSSIGFGLDGKVREVTLAVAGQIAEEAARSMEGQVPPSEPGHAPAIRSGILHDGIKAVSVTGWQHAEAIAYTDVEYAQHLEYGTVHMEARPFMVPAAERLRPVFEAAIVSLLKRL